MSDRINKTIDNVLGNECGVNDDGTINTANYYSDNPDDSGGPTAWGITQAVADEHGLGPVKDITEAHARSFYYAEYVQAPNYDTIGPLSEAIMEELVDTGVNCGMGTASQYLQRSLNFFNRQGSDYPDIKVDGMIGSKTRAALRAYLKARPKNGELVMLRALNSLQGAHYISIAKHNEKDETFAFGWFLNRVEVHQTVNR